MLPFLWVFDGFFFVNLTFFTFLLIKIKLILCWDFFYTRLKATWIFCWRFHGININSQKTIKNKEIIIWRKIEEKTIQFEIICPFSICWDILIVFFLSAFYFLWRFSKTIFQNDAGGGENHLVLSGKPRRLLCQKDRH